MVAEAASLSVLARHERHCRHGCRCRHQQCWCQLTEEAAGLVPGQRQGRMQQAPRAVRRRAHRIRGALEERGSEQAVQLHSLMKAYDRVVEAERSTYHSLWTRPYPVSLKAKRTHAMKEASVIVTIQSQGGNEMRELPGTRALPHIESGLLCHPTAQGGGEQVRQLCAATQRGFECPCWWLMRCHCPESVIGSGSKEGAVTEDPSSGFLNGSGRQVRGVALRAVPGMRRGVVTGSPPWRAGGRRWSTLKPSTGESMLSLEGGPRNLPYPEVSMVVPTETVTFVKRIRHLSKRDPESSDSVEAHISLTLCDSCRGVPTLSPSEAART